MDETQHTHTPSSEETAQNTTQDVRSEEQTTSPKKNYSIFWVIAIVALVLGGLYVYTSDKKTSLQNQATISGGDYPEVVAVVNGEEISGDKLASSVKQSEQIALQQGLDLSDLALQAQIQDQALTVVVNTVLLIQAAENAGVVVTEEEVDNQIALIETQLGGHEAFIAQVEALGLSDEQLHADIHEQLLIDAYLKENTDINTIEITQQEIQAFYDSLVSAGQELPPLEEVASQIDAQLAGQKQQEVVALVIENLRADADIEIKI